MFRKQVSRQTRALELNLIQVFLMRTCVRVAVPVPYKRPLRKWANL